MPYITVNPGGSITVDNSGSYTITVSDYFYYSYKLLNIDYSSQPYEMFIPSEKEYDYGEEDDWC